VFGLAYPTSLSGIDTEVLNPRIAWENIDDYDLQAAELAELFVENFKTYGAAVSYLESAGPLNQNEVAI
jgi:phosphoenolpyruvate carboxykinase (ATP)